MLVLKNIRKKYEADKSIIYEALKDINLTIENGEFLVVLGRSGSGKSTLLNLIGGLDKITDGELIIDGVSTKEYSEHDWDLYRNQCIGFVFQSFNLINHLTVYENVDMALKISGLDKKERKMKVEAILKRVDLEDQINKKPGCMSGGQQQRVAIARALVNEPAIILADEPTGALDVETSTEIMKLLNEVGKDRIVVLVTHEPDIINEYGTRVIKVEDGRIINDYSLKETNNEIVSKKETKNRKLLSLKESIKLSFSNLRKKKKKAIITSFGIIVGSFAMLLGLALGKGGYDFIYDELRENASLSSYDVISESGFTEQQIIDIKNLDNVAMVEERYDMEPNIFNAYEIVSPFVTKQYGFALNILPSNKEDFMFKDDLVAGRYPENENEMLINVHGALVFICYMNRTPYFFKLYETGEFTIEDIWFRIQNYPLVIYENQYNEESDQHEKVPIDDIKIVGMFLPNVNEYRNASASFIFDSMAQKIYLAQNRDLNLTQEDLKPASLRVFMKKYDLDYRAQLKNSISSLNEDYIFDEDLDTDIEKAFTILDTSLIVIVLLVFVAFISAFFMVSVVVHSSVVERTKEIGILKAIGASKKNILTIFLSEGVLIGIIGGFLGLLVATGAMGILNFILNRYLLDITNEVIDNQIFVCPYYFYILTVFTSVFVALIASVIPSTRAAKIYPIDALREE